MACVIKLPEGKNKGVVTFTSIEYDYYISQSGFLYKSLFSAREKWIIGLHYNSAHKNDNFIPDHLFDFYIAGPGDIISRRGKPFHQIEMDCSNFCQDFFEDIGVNGKKYWDLLSVSRDVKFKLLNDLLIIIRKLFDQKPVRALAIVSCDHDIVSSGLIKNYLRLFNEKERRYFTLLMPFVDYPFPFDLETLAFYYQHSRVFLHAAQKERHPRVVAYAWAGGLPVVAPSEAGALLPGDLRRPPGFHAYYHPENAVSCIKNALQTTMSCEERARYSQFHLSKYSVDRFKKEIARLFAVKRFPFADKGWLLNNLDIRLARHNTGFKSPNSVPMSLYQFSLYLNNPDTINSSNGSDFELNLYEDAKKVFKSGLNDKKVYIQLKLNNARSRAFYLSSKLKDKIRKALVLAIKIPFKLFFKAKFSRSPNKDILYKQIDRTFEHLALDNAVVNSGRMISQIQKNLAENKKINILTVGCCNMIEIDAFKSRGYKNIVGIDLVSFNKKYIKVMDMHEMDFPDNSFDLIYCAGSFHCTYDPQKLVQEFVRVLKDNGYVCITIIVDFPVTDVYRYDPKSLGDLHALFGSHINKVIWSEMVEPMTEFNSNANVNIRTIFTIKK